MPVRDAFAFLQRARTDAAIQRSLNRPEGTLSGDELVEIARAAGFDVTPEDLQTAFRHDWTMRQIRFSQSAKRSGESGGGSPGE